jgi:hypothetical protein
LERKTRSPAEPVFAGRREIRYADGAIITAAVLRSVARRTGIDAVREHWPGTDDGFTVLFGLRTAVPMLTLTQLSSNGSRFWLNRGELRWSLIGWFALGAVPGAVAGGLPSSKTTILIRN